MSVLIAIIRHAEKPAQSGDLDLSPAGVLRARMLAQQIPVLYPALSDLFAAADSAESRRPVETIQPLAAALQLPINSTFADHDHHRLAKFLLDESVTFESRTVLVCWHHQKIPALAGNLGALNAPDTWPDDVFDQIWEITPGKHGSTRFTVKQQPLFPLNNFEEK